MGLSGFVSFFEWRICVGSVPDGDAIKKILRYIRMKPTIFLQGLGLQGLGGKV